MGIGAEQVSSDSRGVSHNDAISELEVGVDITWDANLLLQLLVLSAVNDISLNERASQISSEPVTVKIVTRKALPIAFSIVEAGQAISTSVSTFALE